MTGRRGRRRRRKLLDDFKERRGYSNLKEEDLDRTMWRARFGTGFGPVVRQTAKLNEYIYIYIYKVNFSRYRPGVAHRVGRGIALLFHDRCSRRGQQHAPAALYPRERPGTHFIGGWVALVPVWTGGKSRPHGDSIPDRPAPSQSL